jgi:hypothetical protein
LCGGDDEPRYLVDAFYSRVMNEAIGFLGSKLINHKRKCAHVSDFQRLLGEHRRSQDKLESFTRRIADLVVKHRRMEQGLATRGLKDLYGADVDTFNAVTHALGYILGDKLYYAMMQNLVTKEAVRELFYDRFEEDGTALTTYLALVSRVDRVKLPKRSI